MRILLFVFMFYFSNPINVLNEAFDCEIEFYERVEFECTGIDHYFSYSSGCEVSYINVKIFNYWGNIVEEITKPDFEWGGEWQGKPLPDGIYYYACILKYENEEKYKYHEGNIQIFR